VEIQNHLGKPLVLAVMDEFFDKLGYEEEEEQGAEFVACLYHCRRRGDRGWIPNLQTVMG
jgi:hypothetical protein